MHIYGGTLYLCGNNSYISIDKQLNPVLMKSYENMIEFV